jgi:hypothetical protein
VLIVMGGAWLRGVQLTEPLWVDELHTSWVVADGIHAITPRAQAGNQSPLFFYVVWASTRLCGHAEWALRLPSFLAGVALIALAGVCTRRWSGAWAAGLLVALLVAVNHECILFANEARPYAAIQLFSLLHGAVFLRVVERPTIAWRVPLVLGAAGLFYLHYTAALFLVAEVVCYGLLLVVCPRHVQYRPRQVLVDAVLACLLMLPAWPHLARIAERRDNWKSFVRLVPYAGLRAAFWLYVVAPLGGLAISRILCGKLRSSTTTSAHWMWVVCWLAVPATIAFVTTLSNLAALWMLRYFVASLVAAIVLAGLVFARFPTLIIRSLAAVVFVAGAIHFSGILPQWRDDGRIVGDRNENWPAAVSWIDRKLPDSAHPVVLCPGLIEDRELLTTADAELIEYCLFPLRGIYRLPHQNLAPLPTTSRLQVPPGLQRLLSESGATAAIVRARPETAATVQAKLVEAFAAGRRESVRVEAQRFGFLTAFVIRRL